MKGKNVKKPAANKVQDVFTNDAGHESTVHANTKHPKKTKKQYL